MKELNVCFTAAFYPAGMYLFKVSNGITGTMCEIYLKLTIKTPERRQRCGSGVFIVNVEYILYTAVVFLF